MATRRVCPRLGTPMGMPRDWQKHSQTGFQMGMPTGYRWGCLPMGLPRGTLMDWHSGTLMEMPRVTPRAMPMETRKDLRSGRPTDWLMVTPKATPTDLRSEMPMGRHLGMLTVTH